MYAGSVVEMGTSREVFRNPRHPYTRGLLNSVPTLRSDRSKPLQTIEGTVPPIFGDATRLHLRAALRRFASPAAPMPCLPLVEVSPGHFARCPVRRAGGPLSHAAAAAQRRSCQPGGTGGLPGSSSGVRHVWRTWATSSATTPRRTRCASAFAQLNCPVVRGNHDRACSGLSNLAEFNLVAAMSARWTQMTLDPDHQEWLRNLPRRSAALARNLPGIEFVHGSPRDEDEYVLNAPTAALDFHLPGHTDVIFFGHTHVQGGFAFNVTGW